MNNQIHNSPPEPSQWLEWRNNKITQFFFAFLHAENENLKQRWLNGEFKTERDNLYAIARAQVNDEIRNLYYINAEHGFKTFENAAQYLESVKYIKEGVKND